MAGIKFTSRKQQGNSDSIKINWKDVAGKAGENAANIFAPVMPTTVGTAINTTQALRDMRRATRAQRITQRQQNDRSAQDAKKSLAMLNSAFGDIEKGNYSLDRTNRELYDDYESDTAEDFEMPRGDQASSMSSDEILLLGNRGIAKSIVQSSSAQLRGMQGLASALINANIKSSRAIMDSTSASMRAGFNALNTSITITNQKLDSINNSIQSILAFNNQNTIQFYQTAIQMMNGMGAMMENLQNNITPTERDKGRRFDLRNGFSPKAFLDYIVEGAKESALGAMLGMGGGPGGYGSMFGDGTRINPSLRNLMRNGGRGFAGAGGIMGMVLNQVVPKSIENSLAKFDKSFQHLMETGMARLGEFFSNNALLSQLGLGDIIGNKRENLSNVRMGRYMKDALPWNGMAQKALVEVIPEYLSSLESSVNALAENFVDARGRRKASEQKRYYDYNGGQFMSQKELRKQFESEYMDRITLALKEGMDSLSEVVAGTGRSEKDQEAVIQQIERLIDQRITSASSGAPAQENWRKMTEALATFGVGKDQGLSVINQITAGVSEAISQLNDLTHEVETTQNVYRNLNTTHHNEAFTQMRTRMASSGEGSGTKLQYRGFSKIGSIEKYIRTAETKLFPNSTPFLYKDRDMQATVINLMYAGLDEKDMNDSITLEITRRRQQEDRRLSLIYTDDLQPRDEQGRPLGGLAGMRYKLQRGMARGRNRLDEAADVLNPYLERGTSAVINRIDRTVNGRSAWDMQTPPADDGESIGNGPGQRGRSRRRRAIGYGPAEMGRFAAANGYISQGGANAGLFTEGAARLGMRATPIGDTRQLRDTLASGRPVILGGKSTGFGSPYTAAGHVVSADKLVGNKARVLDPITGRKSFYDINALGAGATNAWGYDAIGYGGRRKRRKAASSRATQRDAGLRSSEVDARGVAGIEKQALVSTDYALNRSQTEIDRDMNLTNKLIGDMQDQQPADTVEQSIIQSNNMVRAALGNVIAHLNAGMSRVFGKEGFFRKLWDSDERKEITGKLFTNEDAIFGDQYRWVKEKFGNFKERVGSEVAKGYDFLYDNTMQYLYGKDEEGNDINYLNSAKWQNSRLASQLLNRRYRSDQKAIKKAKKKAEKDGTELPEEFQNTVRDYVQAEEDENDPDKIVRSSFDMTSGKWTTYTAAQWKEELKRREEAKKESAGKKDTKKTEPEAAPASDAATVTKTLRDTVNDLLHGGSKPTGDGAEAKSVGDKVKEVAANVREDAADASKKLVDSVNDLVHSHEATGAVVDKIAASASDAAEVITTEADKLKEDLSAVRETLTGKAGEEAKAKSAAFKKSFIEKMKAAMPKALVAAGAGAVVGGLNAMAPSVLGAMFLPGGPMAGAIFGGALSLLSQTEAFKTFMFGKQNPETQKREGGLISEKMQASFKKAAPYLVGGAVLGAMKGLVKSAIGFNSGLGVMGVQLLPGGILGGALLGAGIGLLKNSESFKKMLFGEKGEDGKRSGKLLSDGWNKASKAMKAALPKFGKAAAGAGVGVLTGAVLSNAGMLPAMLSVGGPVGMGIMGLGLGIASGTSKFNEWLFGSEMLDENGNPTGKRYKDGVLSRVQNLLMTNVIEPIGTSFKNNMLDLVDWTKDKITYPFRLAFGPILDAFTNIKDDIVDFVHDTFEKIGNGIMDTFKGAIKTVFSPITKIVGFVGKNISGITTAGVKLALTPLSIGLGGLSAITSPKRGKEYAKYYSEYYKSGLMGKLQDYWKASKADGNARTFGQKFSDIVDTFTGKGVIGDEFYDTYNQQMEENGEGHLGWRRVPRERKQLRQQRKERRADEKKWRNIDAERRKIINRELGGREVELTDDKVKDYRKRFKKLGIDPEKLQSSEDIMNLLYHRGDFKDSLDPNKKAKGEGGETDEQKKAREKTSEHQDHVEAFLEDLRKSTTEIAGAILEQKHIDKERKDWQNRKKRLKRRAKRAGVKIDLKDDLLRYWDTDRLNTDTLEDFKFSGEKDLYTWMYNKGFAHRENAEVNQQIKDILARMGFDSSKDEIPDVEGQPAPDPGSAPVPAPKKKRGNFLTRIFKRGKKKKKEDEEDDQGFDFGEDHSDEESTVGFGVGVPFTHTPIGYGPDKEKAKQRSTVKDLLTKISNSISGLAKTANEQKEIQSAQLEVATQGEIDDDTVAKKRGKSFGSRVMSKFNAFTSWLGFNKKKEAADREAAESAAARNRETDDEEGSEVNVNINQEAQEEKKTGFLGTLWKGLKSIGGFITGSKVGSFLIKGAKWLGSLGLLGTVGFTIAELVRPGTAEQVGSQIDKISAYINSDDFSLGKMFVDIRDFVGQKLHDFGGWIQTSAYPWLIEHTGPVGQFFDEKVMPWLNNTGEKVGGWWEETAWPFLKELPGKMLDGFVVTAGVVGDFITNNTGKIIDATATVVEHIIEPMGKLVVDLFIGIGKGLWAYIQKKFNPFAKDVEDDISDTDAMFANITGKNVNYQTAATAGSEDEAIQMMNDLGYENSQIQENEDGTYSVINRRMLGKRTAVTEDNETTNVARGNLLSAVFKQGINLANPVTRKATIEGLKLGGKAGVGGVKTVLGLAGKAGNVLGKLPLVGNVFKAGGAASNIAKGAIELGEKGVSKAGNFFSGLAQKFGAKAAGKAVQEGAEEALEEVAEEVVEKGAQTVAKEAAEKGVMATIKEILKKAIEATEKAATNGILEKAVESLGKSKSGIISKIIKKIVEVLNNISKVPAKFANKVLETLQGSLTKATGETAVGAGTAGISIAIMAAVGGIMGAIDAPNLFGVKAEDCTGGMRVVSAIFEALLSIPWVGTFLEAAMLIMSFAFNRNLKQELATAFYEFVCAGDQEKIANLETSRAQMDTERQVYNKLHGTNLDTDAYNDLENKTLISKGLDAGKNAVNWVTGLFGKQVFNVADSTDSSVDIVKALNDAGFSNEEINKMSADELKAQASKLGLGYGPSATLNALKAVDSATRLGVKSIAQATGTSMRGLFAKGSFNNRQSVNESMISHTVGRDSADGSMLSLVKGIYTQLIAIGQVLGVQTSITASSNQASKSNLLTNVFNSILSGIASTGLIQSTNISELKTNIQNMASNSTILSKIRSTLQKLNPGAYTAMGYGAGDMYKQGNSAWGNMPIGVFPNGQTATMKDAGCGPTALAAVANQLMGYGLPPEGFGPVSPAEVGAYAASNGYISGGGANAGLFTEGAARLGLKGTQLSDATGVKASLMSGQPVVMTGQSASSGDPYTKAGHIVVADGIRGNKASVLDPMTGKHRFYDLNSMARRTQHAWSYSRPVGFGPRDQNEDFEYLYGTTSYKPTTSFTYTPMSAADMIRSGQNPLTMNPAYMATTGGTSSNNIYVTVTGQQSTSSVDLFGTMAVSETAYDAIKYFGRHVDASGIDSLAMDKNYEYFKNKTNNFAKSSGTFKNCSNYNINTIGNDKKTFTRSALHWVLNTQFFGLNGGKYGNITIEYTTRGARGNAVHPSTVGKAEKLKILAAGVISKMQNNTKGPINMLPLSIAEKTAIICNGLRVKCGVAALASYLSTRSNFSKLLTSITDAEIETAYNSATGRTTTPAATDAVVGDLVNSDGSIDEGAVSEMAATPAATKGLFSQEELDNYNKWKAEQDAGKGIFGKAVSGFTLVAKIIKAKISSILNGTNFYDELAKITTEESDAMYGVDSSASGTTGGANSAITVTYGSDGSEILSVAGNTEKEKIWNYLRGSGLQKFAAAGIMGNWEQESNNSANKLECWSSSAGDKKDIVASRGKLDNYTQNVVFPAYVRSGISINRDAYKYNGHYYPGMGLVQWTGERGYKFLNFNDQNRYDWTTLGPQLKFFQGEFDAKKGLKERLNAATSVKSASDIFYDVFEACSEGAHERRPTEAGKRSGYAQKYFDQFKNLTADTVGFGIGPSGIGDDGDITPTEAAPKSKMQAYREGMEIVGNEMADYLLKKIGIDFRATSPIMASEETPTETITMTPDQSLGSGNEITLNTADQKNFRADAGTTIVTSESGWKAKSPFWTQTRKKGNDGNWGQNSNYQFQGFIYNPATKFTPRLTRPTAGNKYYIKQPNGYSNAILGSPKDSQNNVLANCVGYAYGRFNEIGDWGSCKYLTPCNAGNFIEKMGSGLTWGKEPRLGAVAVWKKTGGAGHVAVVEQINNGGTGYGLGFGPNGIGEGESEEEAVKNMSWGQQMQWLGGKIAEAYGAFGLPANATTYSGTPTTANEYDPNGITLSDDGYVTGDASIVTGNNTEETIWKTLRKAGFSAAGAAGVMGNLYAESGLSPINLQNSYEKKLGYTDSSYTKAVDSGAYNRFVKDSAGYGLAQWTYWSRKQNLLNYAKSQGKSIGDLGMQLQFLISELGSYGLLNSLKSSGSVRNASNDMLLKFEKPANQGTSVQNKRASYSQGYYDKYQSLGFGPGQKKRRGIQIDSPAMREQRRERMIEGRPFTVDPNEFKALGLGDGMRVDAGFDMGSTDGRLDRIVGILTEWMGESRQRGAVGAASSAQTNNQTINTVVNNNTAMVNPTGKQAPDDTLKVQRYKQNMFRQHQVLSGRVNARQV